MKVFSWFLLLFVLACSDNAKVSEYAVAENKVGFEYEEAPSDGEVINVDQSIEVQEQKIIKTAQLSFEANDLDETHQKILQLTKQYKGIVQNDNSGKGYNRLYREMTVRIPTENFQVFVDGISEGVDYFDQREISRRDVTEEFVDLEARLKAKRELETRYLQLLSQARNVEEMLQIERELSKIREEIEAKQGRLKYLENRVSMSTVSLNFYKLTSQTGVTQSYGQKMLNSIKGGWDGISMFFLGLLYLWPLFLIAIIVVIVLRRYLKRRKRLKKNS